MKKIYVKELSIALAGLVCYTCLGSIFIVGFFSGSASNAHFSIAITITTTIFVGGCLLLFVENQHVEGEIASRYHSVMRPFYVSLMAFLKVVSQFIVSIRSDRGDEVGFKAKESLKKITGELIKLSSRSIISGDSPHYIKAEKLSDLCEQIQGVWTFFEDNHGVYDHIVLDTDCYHIENLRNYLKEYNHSLYTDEIQLWLFPSLCGDFYCKVWQPVQNVPFYYEHFMKRAEVCNIYFVVSITIEALCLVLLLFSDSYAQTSVFLCDALVLISIFSFLICLHKFQELKMKSVIKAF